MKTRFGIATKLTLVLVVFAAALLAGIGALAYRNGRDGLEAAAFADLLSTALEKEAALDRWALDIKSHIAALAAGHDLREASALLAVTPPGAADARATHDRLVADLQNWAGAGLHYTSLAVVEAQTGRVVAATDPAEEGKFRKDRDYFVQGLLGPYVQNPYYDIVRQQPAMTAAAPIRSEDGRVVAVLAGQVNLDDMNSIVLQRTGLQHTGDAFLVNTSHLFVTQPRLVADPAVLQRGVHTEAVNRCLAERGSTTLQADDYRGVPSFIVYRWLPERELCLIVKMDEAEALAPVYAFGNALLLAGALVLLGALLLSASLARTVTRPVAQLVQGAQAIRQGNLEHRIALPGGDELAQLASEFNAMAGDLQRSRGEIRAWTSELERRVAEQTERIRTSEERYRLLFENLTEGFTYCQMLFEDGRPQDFIYLEVNAAFAGIAGLRDVVGKKVTEVIPGIRETDPELFEIFGRVAAIGRPERFEIFLEALALWFSISVYGTAPGYFVAVFDNITERKRAEQGLQRHADRLAAVSRLGRVISSDLDLDQVYDAFVREMSALVPLDRTSIVEIDEPEARWRVARQWTRRAPELQVGEWHPLAGSTAGWVVAHREPFVEREIGECDTFFETEPLRREGMRSRVLLPLSVAGRVIGLLTQAGAQPGGCTPDQLDLLVMLADQLAVAIQNARLYEQAQQHAADLERRVAERTATLAAANRELEAFSYSVSHDLRAPLRAVAGFSRILLEAYAAALPPKAQDYLQRVNANTEHMARLIDDLLALSRLSRLPLNRQTVAPAGLVRQVLADLQAAQPERRVELRLGDLPDCHADPALLKQVFVNLLSNAFKFTGRREIAVIEVGCREMDGRPVYFVKDNGAGFDMQYAGKLFGVFQRLHRTEDYEGTGVGLALVQRIVLRHGGRAWAEAEVDRGATFFFTLGDDDGRE